MAHSSDQGVSSLLAEHHLPAIAAAFLVTFDVRKGYIISWQKSLEGVKLDGVVEFKSLPSGLHNVEEDLVYFVHEEYAGISAFSRRDDVEAARNALMLSVGVLVPVESGRMGKSFLYAQELKELVRTIVDNPNEHEPLDQFWEKHSKHAPQEQESPTDTQSSEGYQKLRALSTSSVGTPGAARKLPRHHPALALPESLSKFGPLMFPLCRAALLRKRILILGEAPVETACDYVYNLSILSTISKTLAMYMPGLDTSKSRLRPLFNVGVSDIATLESLNDSWIACTTDDVLATKPQLFDLLVILPNSVPLQKGGQRTYPRLIVSTPELSRTFPKHGLRATQRDARLYAALKQGLQSLPSGAATDLTQPEGSDGDSVSISSSIETLGDHTEAVEPKPWSLIAYTSLVWWASAGDSRSGLMEAEELATEQDEALLEQCVAEEGTTKEVAMVAYFHKRTNLIISVLSNAVRRNGGEGVDHYRDDGSEADNDDQTLLSSRNDDNNEPVEITEEDVRAMGLDVWSESDKKFISEMVQTWWNRNAVVRGGSIECCGVRLL